MLSGRSEDSRFAGSGRMLTEGLERTLPARSPAAATHFRYDARQSEASARRWTSHQTVQGYAVHGQNDCWTGEMYEQHHTLL